MTAATVGQDVERLTGHKNGCPHLHYDQGPCTCGGSATQDRPGGHEPTYAEHPGFGIWPCDNPWHTTYHHLHEPSSECPDCPNHWWASDGSECPDEYALLAEIRWLREQVNSGRTGRERLEGLPEGTLPRV